MLYGVLTEHVRLKRKHILRPIKQAHQNVVARLEFIYYIKETQPAKYFYKRNYNNASFNAYHSTSSEPPPHPSYNSP
jgi:hypothetical protein